MPLFNIDKSKCNKDGICAKVCPKHIVSFDDDGFPYVKPELEKDCIYCGHCIAVCPKSVLNLDKISAANCKMQSKEWKISYEKLDTFMKSRRSIRFYKKNDIEQEKIRNLIDTARYAPTGLNIQPVKWKVIYGTKKVEKAVKHSMDFIEHMINTNHPWAKLLHFERFLPLYESGRDPILLNAPAVILVHGKKDEAIINKDCVIAMSYLELSAYSMGLGACWAGYFEAAVNTWEPLKEYLKIPEDNSCYGALMLGYPKYKYKLIPERNNPEISWI